METKTKNTSDVIEEKTEDFKRKVKVTPADFWPTSIALIPLKNGKKISYDEFLNRHIYNIDEWFNQTCNQMHSYTIIKNDDYGYSVNKTFIDKVIFETKSFNKIFKDEKLFEKRKLAKETIRKCITKENFSSMMLHFHLLLIKTDNNEMFAQASCLNLMHSKSYKSKQYMKIVRSYFYNWIIIYLPGFVKRYNTMEKEVFSSIEIVNR